MDNRYDETGLQVSETEEVLVTNAAIKATDVMALVGVTAFAAGGVYWLINKRKQKKLLDERQAFQDRMLKHLEDSGASEEVIKQSIEILNKNL